jgi:hypothetical protein
MDSRELLNAWALEVLRERGYSVDEDASVDVSLDTEVSGCCDMCFSTDPVVVIKQGSKITTVTWF